MPGLTALDRGLVKACEDLQTGAEIMWGLELRLSPTDEGLFAACTDLDLAREEAMAPPACGSLK